MKKGLKIGLITGASILIAGGARAGLTKAGIIPNWLGIEALCPYSNLNNSDNAYDSGNIGDEILNEDILDNDEDNDEDNQLEEENHGDILDFEGIFSGEDRNLKKENKNYENLIQFNNIQPADDYDIIIGIDEGYKGGVYKPIIYIYPTSETKINVTLGTPKNLSHTYPKYNSEKGRNVVAQPNGDLEDIDTGRKLYALYREGESGIATNFDEGFVVAGKDIIPFLEEKLAMLGLNEREAEEFIVYWLPQMEGNEWNLIRFETKTEQDRSMPLNITPTPDTIIRVMMDWKAIDEPIDIPEQQLSTPRRSGFTVVEWGGSPRN